ncbi:extensin [Mesorhizobium sp. L-8-10]|uniref:extensin-like domain-containing protein n=1 Tax=Mesorhizobium sp. L-8-10 TaxID=2744523 RepID=UPI001935376E|nr:extensin [Mesorhizobium sp. L-8-10]
MSSFFGDSLADVIYFRRSGLRGRHAVFGTALLAAAMMSACSTDNVLSLRPEVDVGTTTASFAAGAAHDLAPAALPDAPAPAVPSDGLATATLPAEPAPTEMAAVAPAVPALPEAPTEPMVAAYPRVDNPIEALPEMSPAKPEIMPADEVSCRKELERLGVQYVDLAPINDGGACRIEHPVKVSAIGRIQMKPAASLRCEMAATFAAWTRRELAPTARTRYFSGVKTIHQGSSYSCRRIRGTGVASEHSKGNALDIMRIELNNGRDIDVRKPGWFAFRQRGFLNSVRADGCEYFNTVLGPGYDWDHRNHFHFDIKARRNGRVACR